MRMVFYIHLGTWVERFVLIVATNVWLVYGWYRFSFIHVGFEDPLGWL